MNLQDESTQMNLPNSIKFHQMNLLMVLWNIEVKLMRIESTASKKIFI